MEAQSVIFLSDFLETNRITGRITAINLADQTVSFETDDITGRIIRKFHI
jgi:hypothetical protein